MQHAVGGTHLRERPIVLSVALFLLITLLVIVPASPARAAILAVDNTADLAASGDVSDGVCDAGAGECTLRAAVQEANGSEGADVITLTAATYTLTIPGPTEDAALTGDLDVTEDVTINGAATGTTIDADALDRVFHVHPGATLTLDNVTITGGAEATGAGIQVEATGALDLDLATLTANTATGHGGAIYAAGDVTADLSTISGNSAGGDGGGLYSAGGTHTLSSATVAFNAATGSGGGLAHSAGAVTIGHTILSDNTAGSGNQCSGTVGTSDRNVVAAVAGCTFTPAANDATGTGAGLVALADNGGPTETHALNETSVALDVGGTCGATDQRGITRGASCDAGAFEAIQVQFDAATASRAEDFGTYNLAVTIDGSNPHADTTVTVGQTGGTATLGTDYTLSNTDVSFAAGTTSSQSATVTITDDDFGEGDETAILGLSGATGAVLGGTDTHTLTITDNEAVGISLTPATLTVAEGGSDTYEIVLDSEPTSNVTVAFTDGAEADADRDSVTFTTLNWASPREVVVSVTENFVADGTRADTILHTVTSADLDYDGLDPTLPVTITDNDAEAISVVETGADTAVSEATPAATDSYSVVLGSAPVGTVVVAPSFDAGNVAVTPLSHSFDAGDWDTPKNFTVTVVDDDLDEATPHVSPITHSTTAVSDPAYAALTPDPVAVDITDDDQFGITLTPTPLTVAEGGSNSYEIVLDSQPTHDVVVTFTDGTEAGAGLTEVTFTSGNWDVGRNVVVSVPDNVVADGGRADSILHTVASSDTNYDGLDPGLPVTITDDEGQPQVDIQNVAQAETDGTTTFVFDVTVSPVSANPITVTYSTGAASTDPADPSEYESITSGQLIIDPLTATETISVEAYGDDLDEGDERFRVFADDIVGGELVDLFGRATITDDDDTPMADDDTYNVDEGATLSVAVGAGVLSNDNDLDSGTLNALLESAPSDHVGIFTLNANGSFTYVNDGDDGTDTFTYRASDGSNLSQLATVTINVANLDPTVTIGGAPASSPEGTQIDLTAAASDPGGDTVTLSWSVTKGGVPFGSGGSGSAFSFTPDDEETYIVTVMAADGDGGSAEDTATIDVTNVPPTVTINEDPGTGDEGTQLDLTATVVDPGEEPSLNWSVTKDGGAPLLGTGPLFSFTPDDDGEYVIEVTADDGDGGLGTDSITIDVANVDPTVPDPAGGSIDEGGSFVLSAPFTDVGRAETHTAVVDWGDGTTEDCFEDPGCALTQPDGLSGTVAGTHTYADDGAYTVTVTVSDGTGSDAGTATVDVANVVPVVDAPTPASISEGGTYTFAGAFVDPGADTWLAEVDYGDGTDYQALTLSGMTFALDHLYVDDGAYTVDVCVADDDQGTTPHTDGTCESGLVTVNNVAPELAMREDMELGADLTATLTGITPTSFTDAGIVDTHSATVDWGDGTVEAADVNGDGTITANHTYTIAGEVPRTVTVTVTDDGGDSDTGTFQVNVENLDFDLAFTAPSSRNEGKSFSISGDFADIDRTGTYEVTVDWGDGSAPETVPYSDTGPGSGAFTSELHRFADDSDCVSAPGQCVILVTVDDLGSNDQGVKSHTVTINNRVPKTAIDGPTTSAEGTKFKLFGNPKDVPDDALTYQWTVTKDTGDGPVFFKSGSFKNINVKPDDGCPTCVYEATYEVTDDDGASTQEVWTIDVTNVAPDAQMLDKSGAALPPVFDGGREGDTVSLQAVFTDPGAADTHTIAWQAKLLDQVIDTGSEATFDFVAPDDGAYFVVLTVTDDDGGVDTPGSPLITVSNAPPKITNVVTDPTPSAGTPVALNVFFEDKGIGDTHSVTVNWGDGSPVDTEANTTSPAALSHTFAAGAHRAKICVADDDGAKKCERIWYNPGAAPVSVGADFNGDGVEDMAVGVPGENSGAGAVNVFYGSSSGPSLAGDTFYRQGSNGVRGTSEEWRRVRCDVGSRRLQR